MKSRNAAGRPPRPAPRPQPATPRHRPPQGPSRSPPPAVPPVPQKDAGQAPGTAPDIRRKPPYLRPDGPGPELPLARDHPARNHIVGVGLVKIRVHPLDHAPFPFHLHPERIEIRNYRPGPHPPAVRRHLLPRIAPQKLEAYPEPRAPGRDLPQPRHQKGILPQPSAQKRVRQTEDHPHRHLPPHRQDIGLHQRPVVRHPLVPAHPVDHRTRAARAGAPQVGA
jgi:hypothetical protein